MSVNKRVFVSRTFIRQEAVKAIGVMYTGHMRDLP